MPVYMFKCEVCGLRQDREMAYDEVAESLMLPCDCCSVDGGVDGLETPHRRVYAFSLAPVKGAGGTPGRFGSAGA